ncbi:MAG: hypothetical protein MJ099_04315 [Clostridia bacterium]|nr:hypothetical protein [Clostridia bacterium]
MQNGFNGFPFEDDDFVFEEILGDNNVSLQLSVFDEVFDAHVTFLQKLSGHEHARIVSRQEFYDRFRFGFCPETKKTKKIKRTYNSYDVFLESGREEKMFNYLIDEIQVVECVSQGVDIPYYKRNGHKEQKYTPDLIFLTIQGYVGIIEVKPLKHMGLDLCLDKYDAMAEYCEENGYLYGMVDPENSFTTFEDMKEFQINEELRNRLYLWYNDSDANLGMKALRKHMRSIKKSEKVTLDKLWLQVVAWVIQNRDNVGIKGYTRFFPAEYNELYRR